jgi:hypothetical protein
MLLCFFSTRWLSEFNAAVDKVVLFLQEQGLSVILPDADSTFHAIKVTAVHYAMRSIPCAFLTICYLFCCSN